MFHLEHLLIPLQVSKVLGHMKSYIQTSLHELYLAISINSNSKDEFHLYCIQVSTFSC